MATANNEWDPEFAPQEPDLEWYPHEEESPTESVEHLPGLVHVTLQRAIGALNGRATRDAIALIDRIRASRKVLRHLPPALRDTYVSVFEVLEHEATVLPDGNLDFGNLPVLSLYAGSVADEIDDIAATSGVERDPHALWQDLVELVQRRATREQASSLVVAIDKKAPLSELLEQYKQLEPPTARKAVTRVGAIKTGKQVVLDYRRNTAGRDALRFSSGLPTLDMGYTPKGETRGLIAPGEFTVVMGPTGTGKTSFSYSVTPAFGIDLKNWGLHDAYQVMFHTEEESIAKLRGFRMDAGQKFHHLAENLVIDNIGTSRVRMAETIYDLVIQADERSRMTRRPITDFLPYIVQLDYIQSVSEPGEDEKTATANTAEFLLRGVAAWNPEEMAKFSGLSFRDYAGQSWPAGMDHHRVAVLAYAQLVKTDESSLLYKAGKRNVQLSDYVLLDEKDEPYWEVRENDLRLFGKNQMRGSGIIAQNAHAILILHRSVPYANPAKDIGNGVMQLTDTRARILFDKSRAGSRLPYAPMRFDVQRHGNKAMYFDEIAEKAIEAGKLANYDEVNHTEFGDPILPVRPKVDPLEVARY